MNTKRHMVSLVGPILSLMTFFLAVSPPVWGLTVIDQGRLGDCFCRFASPSDSFLAFGLLDSEDDAVDQDAPRMALVIFRAIGLSAPPPGTRIVVDDRFLPFRQPSSKLVLCVKYNTYGISAPENERIRCEGVERPTAVRHFDEPYVRVFGGVTLEQLCTQPRDIYKIMGFLEEIDFDDNRCYREIVDALDLVDPFQPPPEPEGCNGGNPLGLLWPMAGLVLLARRRRTPPPV